MDGFYFVERDSAEWIRMWGYLQSVYGDCACYDESTGEVWQYMGTELKSGEWAHCFRHRCLPPIGERKYYRVPVSMI